MFVEILRPRHIVVDRYKLIGGRTPVARQAQTVIDTFGSRYRPFGDLKVRYLPKVPPTLPTLPTLTWSTLRVGA